MNKFKIGDRIKIYLWAPFTGVVTYINPEYPDVLGVTEDGFDSCHSDSPFHYKACRKLIKKGNKK